MEKIAIALFGAIGCTILVPLGVLLIIRGLVKPEDEQREKPLYKEILIGLLLIIGTITIAAIWGASTFN